MPRFSTTAPGSEALGALSASEFEALCADGRAFAARLEGNATFSAGRCRVMAFLDTAFGSDDGDTDTELRARCSVAYSQCLNAPAERGDEPDVCEAPDAGCTATVAEYTRCINDGVSQTRAQAADVPECAELTRADIPVATDLFVAARESPPSCRVVQSKCSGVSAEAQAFIADYCELVDSCCSSSGRQGNCEQRTLFAARQGSFDAGAAASCLAELRGRQSQADYCVTLAAYNAQPVWAVSAECAPVFGSGGTLQPGEVCGQDSDCAPGPNGGATCAFKIDTAGNVANICLHTSRQPGDGPCVGTTSKRFGTSSRATETDLGVLCDSDAGVVCDAQLGRCIEPALGTPCTVDDECAVESSYCNVASGTCAARLPVGEFCSGTALAECAGDAYCAQDTRVCTAPGGAGAACTSNLLEPECIGYCDAGTCSDPLDSICF